MLNLSRKLTWGLGLLAMVWLVGGTACLEDTPGVCSEDIQAKVESLTTAADSLIVASEALKLEVAGACYAIAMDLDVPDPLPAVTAEMTDDDVTTICTAAVAAIDAQLEAGVTVDVLVQGGYCEVNAEAQFDCEANCQVEGTCDPGSIETRCDPGYLSVVCDGACEANAYCQGSVEIEANCSGECAGACDGTCAGEPIEGAECVGRCEGTCTGECHLAADAEIECGAEVRCRGGCTVEGQAPRCETEIEPPACDIDADCEAGCQGQATFEAECYEPEVLVVVTGALDEDFLPTLETNLPIIWNAYMIYGPMIVEQSVEVAAAAAAVADSAAESTLCNLLVAGQTSLTLLGAYEASVTIDVTVTASASVGGSVSAE